MTTQSALAQAPTDERLAVLRREQPAAAAAVEGWAEQLVTRGVAPAEALRRALDAAGR